MAGGGKTFLGDSIFFFTMEVCVIYFSDPVGHTGKQF